MRKQLEKWTNELYEVGIAARCYSRDLQLRNLTFKEKKTKTSDLCKGVERASVGADIEATSLSFARSHRRTARRHLGKSPKGNSESRGPRAACGEARGAVHTKSTLAASFCPQRVPRS